VFPRPEALLSEATNVLGTDGQKMSKSRGNTIELGMDADATAKQLKRAVTDADRHITYDPVQRPEVSNLVLITALATGRRPEDVAEEIGDGGGAALKKAATEAVNEMLAPVRARRTELAADPGHLLDVLRRGNERANAIAEATLGEVREAMQMVY
jgi:tryptophanyl-tRNA synthetase